MTDRRACCPAVDTVKDLGAFAVVARMTAESRYPATRCPRASRRAADAAFGLAALNCWNGMWQSYLRRKLRKRL